MAPNENIEVFVGAAGAAEVVTGGFAAAPKAKVAVGTGILLGNVGNVVPVPKLIAGIVAVAAGAETAAGGVALAGTLAACTGDFGKEKIPGIEGFVVSGAGIAGIEEGGTEGDAVIVAAVVVGAPNLNAGGATEVAVSATGATGIAATGLLVAVLPKENMAGGGVAVFVSA